MNQLHETAITCPYCGETIGVLIDCSVDIQQYIEDCHICCRPINFHVAVDSQGIPMVSISHEDE